MYTSRKHLRHNRGHKGLHLLLLAYIKHLLLILSVTGFIFRVKCSIHQGIACLSFGHLAGDRLQIGPFLHIRFLHLLRNSRQEGLFAGQVVFLQLTEIAIS